MNRTYDIVADLDTPASAFLKLAPLGPRFLLESVEQGQRVGRFSFIGFGDGLDIVGSDGVVSAGEESVETDGTLAGYMEALRKILALAPRPEPANADVPFHGGLVGAVGFDLAYRGRGLMVPGGKGPPEMVFYAPASILAFDHLSRRAALLHAGPEDERLALRRQVIELLAGAFPKRNGHTGAITAATPNLSQAEFELAVDRAKGHIAAGDVYQLVVSVQFEGRADVDPFDVYRGLRLLNPSPYMYYLELDGKQIIGSSPEALVRLDGTSAELRPIAGTRPLTEDDEMNSRAERELLADSKEAAEHVMLVDLARNDLGRVARPGSIVVDPYRSIERYSHVMHIVSGVKGELEPDVDAFDVFASAFPAGTVVGAPKVRAMQLLEEIEPDRRGFYAGTVGYFGHGATMDQAITIRTIVMEDDRYVFQAGAGIVADSDPALEWAEVQSKSGAMRSALEIASEGLS
ncbi:MAG: anthranilate synthase component I family protein [Acidimicrobiia bacterium]|nr:anthranilate synthase component I family protein [Acidimicrobiia bacterium]